MLKPVETELKLRFAAPQQWSQLLASPWLRELSGEAMPIRQDLSSTYFDTPDLRLHRQGIAFRLRQEQDRWTATVKAGGSAVAGLHQRNEWNFPAPGPVPNPSLFQNTPVGPIIIEAARAAPLTPLFTTRFMRCLWNLQTPAGDQIELAADRGEIAAGERREPILEVELELKAGRPAALLTVGAALSRQFPCLLENRSKYLRALRLAGLAKHGSVAVPVPPHIVKDADAAAALTDLFTQHIQYLAAAQECFLTAPDEPENLHQLRVQLQRLRALWSFARPLIAAEHYTAWQEKLRQWSRQLEMVRELDVLLAAWQNVLASGIVPAAATSPLADLLRRRRKVTLHRLHRTTASGAFTPLLLELWAWLAHEGLHTDPADDVSIGDFARRRLGRWSRRLLQDGEHLSPAYAAALHHLRISCKKLCYVVACLADVLPKPWQKFSARLQSLPDSLGLLYDAYVSAALLDAVLGKRPSRSLCREAGLLIGWQAGYSAAVQDRFMQQWRKLLPWGQKVAGDGKSSSTPAFPAT